MDQPLQEILTLLQTTGTTEQQVKEASIKHRVPNDKVKKFLSNVFRIWWATGTAMAC